MGEGAARPQPPLGKETSPGDLVSRQVGEEMGPVSSEREGNEGGGQVSSRDIKQINLNVNRTFHNHIMFWNYYGVSEVGYCQGMSQTVAILLMYLTEDDAFWALAQLMTSERHAMHEHLLKLPLESFWEFLQDLLAQP
ncbi:USP6 N-terminal-like protein [Vulpes lagopus]